MRATYPFHTITEALAKCINLRQRENEDLNDYIKRHKQQRDVLISHMGTDMFDKFVEHTEDYKNALDGNGDPDPGKQDAIKAEAFSKWTAYLLIRGSDQSKYGSVTSGYVDQCSKKNNQYPDSITAATDVLAQHKFDKPKNKDQDRGREGRGRDQ